MIPREGLSATDMQVRPFRHGGLVRASKARRAASTPAPRSLAWALVGLVALLVIGRVASVGHWLFTTHVRCEHGQLVHVTHEVSHQEQGHHSVSEAPAKDDRVAAHSAHVRDGAHEHCNPPAVVDVLAVESQPAVVVQVIDWQVLSPPAAPAATHQAIALLSLAPKSSPPQV